MSAAIVIDPVQHSGAHASPTEAAAPRLTRLCD